MYRIPVRYALGRIIGIASVINLMSLFQRDFLNLEIYAPVTYMLLFVLLLSLSFNLPFLYSTLVMITGFLTFVVVQTLLVALLTEIGLTTNASLISSNLSESIMQSSTAIIIFLLVFFIEKKRLGFMFIVNRFKLKYTVKSLNLFLGIFIIITLAGTQFAYVSFTEQRSLIMILTGLIAILCISLYIIYLRNLKQIEERYERMNK
ncbi:hypothetical protein [Paenibacillus turpanensis]|uniref:hypothetical protein n=1 Tax=Paenibacillus turpanensis TaxID=2689078 RepID=UPI001409194F|nr:hypothetical protein [Paenibacillus turpanensis]